MTMRINGHVGNGVTFGTGHKASYHQAKPRHIVRMELVQKIDKVRRQLRINESMGRVEAAMKCRAKIVKLEGML